MEAHEIHHQVAAVLSGEVAGGPNRTDASLVPSQTNYRAPVSSISSHNPGDRYRRLHHAMRSETLM
jgi:hypothetical protein